MLAAKRAEERGQRELSRFGRDPGFARNPDYGGAGLQLEFTVEDEGMFTRPWSASISYRRPLGEWPEMVCAENPHECFSGRHKLRKAGAIILGKTTLSESAAGGTYGSIFGVTRNPYDLDRTVSGSSGGSGVALATSPCGATVLLLAPPRQP